MPVISIPSSDGTSLYAFCKQVPLIVIYLKVMLDVLLILLRMKLIIFVKIILVVK